MKKLYLHIGIEKTGSTSIQDTFKKFRFDLLDIGVDYPDVFKFSNHVELSVITQGDEVSELTSVVGFSLDSTQRNIQIEEFKNRLRTYVSESKCDVFVFSNEHLHSRVKTQQQVSILKDFLYSIFDEIEVISYFRNQVDLYVSHYSTSVKGGETDVLSFPSHDASINHYYSFTKIIKLWSCFDKVSLHVFDKGTLYKNDVVYDFSKIIDSKIEDVITPIRSNESLDGDCLELLRIFNKNLPFIKNGKVNVDRYKLVEILEKISSNKRLQVDLDRAKDFNDFFLKENNMLSSLYNLNNLSESSVLNKGSVAESSSDYTDKLSELWVEVSNHIRHIERNNLILKAESYYLKGDRDKSKELIQKLNGSPYLTQNVSFDEYLEQWFSTK
jgi:hypothetical protein